MKVEKLVLVVAIFEEKVVEEVAAMVEKVAVDISVVTWSPPNADLSLSTFSEYTHRYE